MEPPIQRRARRPSRVTQTQAKGTVPPLPNPPDQGTLRIRVTSTADSSVITAVSR